MPSLEEQDEAISAAEVGSVGFPDFWPVSHRHFGVQFAAMIRTIDLQNHICAIPLKNTPMLPVVIRWMLQIAANTTGAIMVLAMNGFGSDAMRLARGTFEFDVNALYLARHPEEIDDFIDYRHVTWKNMIDHFDQNGVAEAKRFGPEQRAENAAEYAKVVDRFKNREGNVRRSWAKVSIFKRAIEVGLGDLYPTFYGITSQLHHGDVTGLTQQVDPETGIVIPSPDLRQVDVALNSAHRALTSLITTYNKVVPLGQDALIEKMDADYDRVWKKYNAASV